MTEKILTKGICSHCGELVTRNSAKKHIEHCYSEESKTVNSFIVKVQWPHKIQSIGYI